MTAFSEQSVSLEDYQKLVESIVRVEAPKIKDGHIIFTSTARRHVGIAFSHEDYKHIHSFKKLPQNELYEGKEPILFYIFLS